MTKRTWGMHRYQAAARQSNPDVENGVQLGLTKRVELLSPPKQYFIRFSISFLRPAAQDGICAPHSSSLGRRTSDGAG